MPFAAKSQNAHPVRSLTGTAPPSTGPKQQHRRGSPYARDAVWTWRVLSGCAPTGRADALRLMPATNEVSSMWRSSRGISAVGQPDGVRHPGQTGAGDDDHQSDQQRGFGPNPAGHHTCHQHRRTHHSHVAGEQQRHLRRRGVQTVDNRLEAGIDQTGSHEGDDIREGDGPNGLGLAPHRVAAPLVLVPRSFRSVTGAAAHRCEARAARGRRRRVPTDL
jgi:hypothetical protein